MRVLFFAVWEGVSTGHKAGLRVFFWWQNTVPWRDIVINTACA